MAFVMRDRLFSEGSRGLLTYGKLQFGALIFYSWVSIGRSAMEREHASSSTDGWMNPHC